MQYGTLAGRLSISRSRFREPGDYLEVAGKIVPTLVKRRALIPVLFPSFTSSVAG